MHKPKCPTDGTLMERATRPIILEYRGQSITFDMPGWYCESCEESIHTGEDMKLSDRKLNLLKARSEGLLEPDEIRRIRKKLGLTQTRAGELLGGGPRAFQKYEAGDLLPSRAITSTLVLLDHDPEQLRVLQARQQELAAAHRE